MVLAAIFLGVRMGGIGLGLWGVLGTGVLIFIFGMDPGSPPVNAFFIIIAVITASAAMQAAGGIDFLFAVASKIIRRNPRHITYVAPLVAFAFTVGAGTPGGAVNCQSGVADFETYNEKPQPDGTVAFESAAFPGVYLRMDAQDVGAVGLPAGGGTVNCQVGVGAWEKFLVLDPPFPSIRWPADTGTSTGSTPASASPDTRSSHDDDAYWGDEEIWDETDEASSYSADNGSYDTDTTTGGISLPSEAPPR